MHPSCVVVARSVARLSLRGGACLFGLCWLPCSFRLGCGLFGLFMAQSAAMRVYLVVGRPGRPVLRPMWVSVAMFFRRPWVLGRCSMSLCGCVPLCSDQQAKEGIKHVSCAHERSAFAHLHAHSCSSACCAQEPLDVCDGVCAQVLGRMSVGILLIMLSRTCAEGWIILFGVRQA